MRTSVFLAAMAALAFAPSVSLAAAPLPAPIAQASDGKLQCYAPKVETKSCQSLAAYERRPDGTIVNPSTVLISPSPLITMTANSPVHIKDGQLCGVLRPEHIAAATFQVNGQPASADQTAKLREVLNGAMKAVLGKEVCTTFVTEAGVMTAKSTLDGVAAVNVPVIWVSPSDGYKVQP